MKLACIGRLIGVAALAFLPALAHAIPPEQVTAVPALSSASHQHVELLRIKRNFGKDRYLIALDSWISTSQPATLDGVRLWWLDVEQDGERTPLESWVRRYVEVEYTSLSSQQWRVTLRNDDRAYPFEVKLDGHGRPRVYVTVQTANGRRQRCLAMGAVVEAKRFLGIPTGVGHIELQCRGPVGRTFTGIMVALSRD